MNKAKEFFRELLQNESLQNKIREASEKISNKEDRLKLIAEIAKQNGFKVSVRDLQSWRKILSQSINKLNDADLRGISGGNNGIHNPLITDCAAPDYSKYIKSIPSDTTDNGSFRTHEIKPEDILKEFLL